MKKLIVTPFFEVLSKNELEKLTSDELEILLADFGDEISRLCDTEKNNKFIFRTLNNTRVRLCALNIFSDKAGKKCTNYRISN